MNGEDDEWTDRWISVCISGCSAEWAGRRLDGWGEERMSSRRVFKRDQTLACCVKENSARALSRGNGFALGGRESPSRGRAVLEHHKH